MIFNFYLKMVFDVVILIVFMVMGGVLMLFVVKVNVWMCLKVYLVLFVCVSEKFDKLIEDVVCEVFWILVVGYKVVVVDGWLMKVEGEYVCE